MVLAVRAITGMLVQTMIVPQPGNPGQGMFDVQPRDKPLAFLHTRSEQQLTSSGANNFVVLLNCGHIVAVRQKKSMRLST